MVNSNGIAPRGERWTGFAPGTKAAPDVSGTFRAMVDPDAIRVVDGQYGKQFEVSVRVDLPDREQRVTVWCPYNLTPRSKFVSMLKALNNVTTDLAPSFDLSQLRTDGDMLVSVETSEKGYIEIKSWMPLPRDARGVPMVPGASQPPF